MIIHYTYDMTEASCRPIYALVYDGIMMVVLSCEDVCIDDVKGK